MKSRLIARSGIVAGACITLFIALTIPVALKVPVPGDMELVGLGLASRNAALTGVIQILTFISSSVPALLLCILFSAVEWSWLGKPTRPAGLLRAAWPLFAYSGAAACNVALRIAIGRFRPEVDFIPALLPEVQLEFQRYSYPSGHAGTAMVTYVSMAMLLWRARLPHWATLAITLFIVGGTGFGRIYLGVHWPSDVLGGYLLAGAWVAIARPACAIGASLVELLGHGLRVDP
jgi:undecaprenyl-diphosphatase